MPDAHLGYGLADWRCAGKPINAVIPYAVGVDIACRMKLTIFDAEEWVLNAHKDMLKKALKEETRFGAGSKFDKGNRSEHEVLDAYEWNHYAPSEKP